MIGELNIKPLPCICFSSFVCFLHGVYYTKETHKDPISTMKRIFLLAYLKEISK